MARNKNMPKLGNKILFLTVFNLLAFFIFSPILVFASRTDLQNQLEQELKQVEQQIIELQKQLSVATSQKNTLANKIRQLQIKQQELTAQIRQTSLRISSLDNEIASAETDLALAIARSERLKNELSVTLRLLQQKDFRTIIVLAAGEGLSSAWREAFNYFKLSFALRRLNNLITQVKKEIEDKKNSLADQKEEAENLLQLKSAQQTALSGSLTEQGTLLAKTKGLEKNYSEALSDTKKKAAEIRGRIYELFNTGSQITFGEAVEIANYAGKLTGLRPAFLLAILSQESNLGKNVGTCNRKGDPPEKSWKVIMKPTRDQEPFQEITAELGLDIDTTPVSCPMRDKNGEQIGWGGAMGPAQFIPSTWLAYKNKVSAITGKSPADPWDIRDAFIASAIKLKAGGADGTDSGDWKAAMIYFSGSTNPAYSFYGDSVINLTRKYQEDIDAL